MSSTPYCRIDSEHDYYENPPVNLISAWRCDLKVAQHRALCQGRRYPCCLLLSKEFKDNDSDFNRKCMATG